MRSDPPRADSGQRRVREDRDGVEDRRARELERTRRGSKLVSSCARDEIQFLVGKVRSLVLVSTTT